MEAVIILMVPAILISLYFHLKIPGFFKALLIIVSINSLLGVILGLMNQPDGFNITYPVAGFAYGMVSSLIPAIILGITFYLMRRLMTAPENKQED